MLKALRCRPLLLGAAGAVRPRAGCRPELAPHVIVDNHRLADRLLGLPGAAALNIGDIAEVIWGSPLPVSVVTSTEQGTVPVRANSSNEAGDNGASLASRSSSSRLGGIGLGKWGLGSTSSQTVSSSSSHSGTSSQESSERS